jgi:tRNA dimethylallyltransferase
MTIGAHPREGTQAILLMGPTASGKTSLAVQLVRRLPCEIVSVDSAMVYRGMDIGTAKPGPEIRRVAPHRLIDILDPRETYSAARFRSDALTGMGEIVGEGRIPLLVGGTMLYFRALEQGLSFLPAADPKVRAGIEAEASRVGWTVLHERLSRGDPHAAARIHSNDPQRIQRALEVYELTGRPLTDLVGEGRMQPPPYRFIKLVLAPGNRAILHKRIEGRFHAMLRDGFVGEVERLFERSDLHAELPALRAVGYRQIWAFLHGRLGYAEMVDSGIVATRQYAKRQMTWLRREADTVWFDSENRDVAGRVLRLLEGSIEF